jgi:hypothetical protein
MWEEAHQSYSSEPPVAICASVSPTMNPPVLVSALVITGLVCTTAGSDLPCMHGMCWSSGNQVRASPDP